jgi:hypothetical protein
MEGFIRLILTLILPLILIITPNLFQLVFTIRRLKKKIDISIGFIFLITCALGFIMPIIATYISSIGLSYGMDKSRNYCITGIEVVAFAGFAIVIVLTPLIGIIGALNQYYNKK